MIVLASYFKPDMWNNKFFVMPLSIIFVSVLSLFFDSDAMGRAIDVLQAFT